MPTPRWIALVWSAFARRVAAAGSSPISDLRPRRLCLLCWRARHRRRRFRSERVAGHRAGEHDAEHDHHPAEPRRHTDEGVRRSGRPWPVRHRVGRLQRRWDHRPGGHDRRREQHRAAHRAGRRPVRDACPFRPRRHPEPSRHRGRRRERRWQGRSAGHRIRFQCIDGAPRRRPERIHPGRLMVRPVHPAARRRGGRLQSRWPG